MASWEIRGGRKLAAFIRNWEKADTFEIEVGFLRADKYPDGRSIAQVAQVNEFGSQHVPPRPFMRPAINSLKQLLPGIAKENFNNRLHAPDENMATQLARFAKERVKRQIRIIKRPANSPETIRRKGTDDPLIDTQLMHDKVRYRIHKKGRNR